MRNLLFDSLVSRLTETLGPLPRDLYSRVQDPSSHVVAGFQETAHESIKRVWAALLDVQVELVASLSHGLSLMYV